MKSIFSTKVENAQKSDIFRKKIPPFFSVFCSFSPTQHNTLFFSQFWPIFLFLQEMSNFRLLIYEWTRFFSKTSKLPSETKFCPQKNLFFSTFYSFLLTFFSQSTIPFFFSADFRRFSYSFKKCFTLGCLSTNELDFFQKSQNCPEKPNFAQKKLVCLALFIHFCSFFSTKHNTFFFGWF